jgi:heterodisulfide reductase subunit D
LEKAQSEVNIKKLIQETGAYLCMDCSKCTGSCPIGRVGAVYSPRSVVQHIVLNGGRLTEDHLWRCLTCGLCRERCPADVKYPEFISRLREDAVKRGLKPQTTHQGTIKELMRILAKDNLKQDKMGWLPEWVNLLDGGKSKKAEGDIYFVGCAPYFDTIFADFNLDLVGTHTAALELLKSCGVTPGVLADERCCGHDALWSGDTDLFLKLARANMDLFREAGAKRVFVSCPEGYHTFTKEYPKHFGDIGIEFVNTVQFLAGEMTAPVRGTGRASITYHDSCRMGRFSGLYDEPRALLGLIEGADLREMEFTRDSAPCCGSNLWINCDQISRRMQIDMLSEAKKTGADIMLTSCDKCRIHLACAQMEMGSVKAGIEMDNVLKFLHRKAVRKS